MLNKLLFSLFALLLTISLSAQVPTFTATQNIAKGQGEKIASFTDYQTFTLDLTDLDDLVKKENGNTNFRLKIGQEFDWSFDARNTNLIAPDYQNRTSNNNKFATTKLSSIPTQGYVNGVQADLSALTIGENFLYGFIQQDSKTYYIEPLNYFLPDAAPDAFILYEEDDVIKDGTTKCAAIELENQSKKSAPKEENPDLKMMNGECYTVDLAIASDYSMFQKYGSVAGVENHTVGVMNNVATDYDDAFADEIQFEIVEQYIVTTSGGNPWSSSNDASTLLASFRSWGPNGFSATHDLGQLWTNRDFTGSTVGIAYVGAVCSNYRYQCLQDFTSTAWSLRVLTSHETGHNFNCSHDASGSPHIMAPSVNNTTSWSSNSINTVNNYVNSISCLGSCGNGGGGGGGGGTPPTAEFSANPTSGCAPLNVQFTNQSTGATSYLWTFAGSTTTSQTNPGVTFNAPGTYSVTLVATNASGSDTETKTNYITVGSGNTNLSFTTSINSNTVSFNNNSTGANSYSWNFGDNNTSNQTNPTHTYAASGTYTVTLTGVGACGTESISQSVTIQNNTPPIADFYAPQTSGCTPLAVNFVNTSTGNPTSYQWSFPGGTPSSSAVPNPQVTYANEGIYDVYLTVFNQNGSDTRTISNYISVTESPMIDFTTSQSGNTVTFNNNSEGAGSYIWYFGDGTSSTEANPVHTYGNSGTYNVVLTGYSVCGQDSYNSLVTISNTPPPNAAFSVSATQGCTPHNVQFYNQSSGQISSYAWSFPGGNPATSNAALPSVTYENEGTYPVTLTVSGNGGSSTETKEAYIYITNTPVLDYSVSQVGTLVTIDNNTEGDQTYIWNFGDGYTSISPNPYHTYDAGGTYTISVTANGFCGTMTDSFTVTIDAPPTANFTANQTFGCTDFIVTYENISTGNNNSYQWSFPGGTPAVSTQENPTVSYAEAGTYDAILTVSNVLGEDTFTANDFITVNALPIANFSTTVNGLEATFSNNSENAESYFWNFGDNETSTQANPTHTFANNDTYNVNLTAVNECGEISISETIIISVESNPIADFTANINEGCAPLTVTFNNTSSVNSDSFVWSFTGANIETSNEENPTVTFFEAGNFDVTLIAENEVGSNTKTETDFITVNDLPTADFTFTVSGNIVSFENISTNATTYVWGFGNENTSNETNPTQTFTENGTYEIVLTASNCFKNYLNQYRNSTNR